ncbi:hypothetical protein [Streptomyces sp. NPDC088348]|uniref:hypothetical protein n=1 Tax=Streptomyces sp. NPDC088348 TaxID=3365853 RepID=UPI00382BE2ED
MLTIVLGGLRTRRASFAGSFAAVARGVALLTVVELGLASTAGAQDRAPTRFAATPVAVAGRSTITSAR